MSDPKTIKISPQQYLQLQNGILEATSNGYGPWRSVCWGILCAGIPIKWTALGEFKIEVSHE